MHSTYRHKYVRSLALNNAFAVSTQLSDSLHCLCAVVISSTMLSKAERGRQAYKSVGNERYQLGTAGHQKQAQSTLLVCSWLTDCLAIMLSSCVERKLARMIYCSTCALQVGNVTQVVRGTDAPWLQFCLGLGLDWLIRCIAYCRLLEHSRIKTVARSMRFGC